MSEIETQDAIAEQAEVQEEKPKPVPWYTLNPATIGRSRLVRALAIGLVIVSFSIVPIWRLFWYLPVYGARDFVPTFDAHHRLRAAWHWVDGKEVRIYAAPDVRAGSTASIKAGVEEMVREIRLDFTVKILPMPAKIEKAYRASLVKKNVNGQVQDCIHFGKLESQLIEMRAGDPHADLLVVTTPLAECWWAHGMATFTSGVAILEDANAGTHLGKHESGHLFGYLYHDSLPLYVIGYPWEGWPWSRDSLMVLYGESNDLSPRTRDALHYFWRGLEKRSGKRFLKR